MTPPFEKQTAFIKSMEPSGASTFRPQGADTWVATYWHGCSRWYARPFATEAEANAALVAELGADEVAQLNDRSPRPRRRLLADYLKPGDSS